MRPAYARPETVDEAVAALGSVDGARPIAGGTDLMVQLRLGQRAPGVVVDLGRLSDLQRVDAVQGHIGAGVTVRRLLAEPEAARRWPALVEAGRLLGGRQIQAMATVGGNLCNGSPAAETAPPLLVHDAQVVIRGPHGAREVPLAAFWRGPHETVLEPGELLAEIRLDTPGRSAYRRIELRRSVDIAVVSVAVRLDVAGGRVTGAAVAIGAASPTPCRVPAAEEALVGIGLDGPDFEQALGDAAAAASRAARPIDDTRASARYRTAMLAVLVRRAVAACRGAT